MSDPAESPTVALNRYVTLGLTEDAVVLEESEEAFLYVDHGQGKHRGPSAG